MRIAVAITVGLILLCAAVYQLIGESTAVTSSLANTLFHNNLHEVVPGRLFRSAQMSRGDLGETIDRHKIRSVIDLRLDEDAPDETGKEEADVAREHGAEYRHIPFSSAKAAQRPSLLALLRAYEELPRPILVHCSSGTHRSGVASALWLLDQEGATPETAAAQLSARYGYFQLERDMKAWWTGRPTLDRILGAFASAKKSTGVDLRTWMTESPLLEPPRPVSAVPSTGSTS